MSGSGEEREEELAALLGDLLDRRNRGEALDPETIRAEHPEFAAEIDDFFEMRDLFADALGDAVLDRAYGDEEVQLAERFPLATRLDDLCWGSRHRLQCAPGELPRELIATDPLFGRAARSRLARSIRHAASYQVPGFARILDHGRAGSGPYLVREVMVGPSLRELTDRILESGRMLPEVETPGPGRPADRVELAARCLASRRHMGRLVALFGAWAGILDGGHLRGLVHRELNPDNLGLDELGQPMIQGLGLAWQGTGIEPASLAGWVPQWLAPEVIDPKWGPVTHLADVYALGRALCDALALHLPEAPEDPAGELMHIAVGDRAFLDRLPPGLPGGMRELIERATFPDPSRRLESLARFAERLAELVPPADEEPRSWAARLFRR